MSGVVLRCPNCGTTKATPGECEACHEAQVRYYCTNHTPGHWLETPACPLCGARFGDAPRRPAAPPPVVARTPPRVAASTAAPKRGGPRRVETSGGPWGRRKRPPSPEDVLEEAFKARDRSVAARDAPEASLPEGRGTEPRVRRAPREAVPVPKDVGPPIGPAVGGCFRAVLFITMVLLLAFVATFVLVGGSLLQFFWIAF